MRDVARAWRAAHRARHPGAPGRAAVVPGAAGRRPAGSRGPVLPRGPGGARRRPDRGAGRDARADPLRHRRGRAVRRRPLRRRRQRGVGSGARHRRCGARGRLRRRRAAHRRRGRRPRPPLPAAARAAVGAGGRRRASSCPSPRPGCRPRSGASRSATASWPR